MPKEENKLSWKISELEKKFLALEGEVQVLRREAKVQERKISDLELSNTRLENCLQQIGKKNVIHISRNILQFPPSIVNSKVRLLQPRLLRRRMRGAKTGILRSRKSL